MKNISIKLNLQQLQSAVKVMKGQTGDIECLVIPIEKNHLFKGEKGIYLDLQAFEIKQKREGSKDTHLIKQSLPKEVYEKMDDEERKSQPIIGNAAVWAGVQENIINQPVLSDTDDLPF